METNFSIRDSKILNLLTTNTVTGLLKLGSVVKPDEFLLRCSSRSWCPNMGFWIFDHFYSFLSCQKQLNVAPNDINATKTAATAYET